MNNIPTITPMNNIHPVNEFLKYASPISLMARLAMRQGDSLGSQAGRWWTGARPTETVGQAFRSRPLRTTGRTLWGPKIPHGLKIRGGLSAAPFMPALGETLARVLNFDDAVYDNMRRNMERVGKEFDKSDYSAVRRRVLGEAAKQILGKEPKLTRPGIAAGALRNYGIPYVKEKARRTTAGEEADIPFGFKLRDLLSYIRPGREVTTKNPLMRRIRSDIADRTFDTRSRLDIAREGTQGLARDFVDNPELGMTREEQDAFGAFAPAMATYMEDPARAAIPLYMAGESTLRRDTTPADLSNAALMAGILAPHPRYASDPTEDNRLAEINRAIIDAAPDDLEFKHYMPYGGAYAPRPHEVSMPEGMDLGVDPTVLIPDLHKAFPGIVGHETGHHLSQGGDDWYGRTLRNPDVHTLRQGLPSMTRGLYNTSQYRIVPKGGETGDRLRRGLAYTTAASSIPTLTEETRASALGARHNWQTLEDESLMDRSLGAAGAFGGLPTYYHQALSPLLETRQR